MSSVVVTVFAETVGEVTNPRLDNAVATSPVCWTTGVALKKPNFWLVAVPILVPVPVPTAMLDASFKVTLPTLDKAPDEIESPLIVLVVLAEMVDERVRRPAWVILKLAPEISLPEPELVMVSTSPVAEALD